MTFSSFCFQGRKIESTPLAMYNFFIERVRANLHVVLAMSPIGDAFRSRMRMFPSLINCCTIDWFQVKLHFMVTLPPFPSIFREVDSRFGQLNTSICSTLRDIYFSFQSVFFSMEVPFVSPCREFLIVIESDFTDSEFVRVS